MCLPSCLCLNKNKWGPDKQQRLTFNRSAQNVVREQTSVHFWRGGHGQTAEAWRRGKETRAVFLERNLLLLRSQPAMAACCISQHRSGARPPIKLRAVGPFLDQMIRYHAGGSAGQGGALRPGGGGHIILKGTWMEMYFEYWVILKL